MKNIFFFYYSVSADYFKMTFKKKKKKNDRIADWIFYLAGDFEVSLVEPWEVVERTAHGGIKRDWYDNKGYQTWPILPQPYQISDLILQDITRIDGPCAIWIP